MFIDILFDQPIMLSMVKFWNYKRTPSRGAAHVSISLDGAIVYDGLLRKATPDASQPEQQCQSVVFTNDPRLLSGEMANVHNVQESEFGNRVQLFDHTQKIDRHVGVVKRVGAQEVDRPWTAIVE